MTNSSVSSVDAETRLLSGQEAADLEASLFANYKRAPLAFSHGHGARLFSTGGDEYIDFLGGIATSSLGHAHPRLTEALSDQAGKVLHVSNLFEIPEQSRAAELLCGATGGTFQRALFCNSGAEANEALIKLARLWGYNHPGPAGPRFKIVATHGAFHGRTLGALAATGTPAYRVGFEPLPGGFEHVDLNDLEQLEAAIDEQTCAVLLEAIQGEGGVVPATSDYLHAAERLCRERGVLFLLDEVQTGVGRLGTMYGFQHFGVSPDAISLAKGLGAGVPVGAMLATEALAAELVPGKHGTTFGGNPLAMRAVIAVQEELEEHGLRALVPAKAARLRAGLEERIAARPQLRGLRGAGLMMALLFEEEAAGDVAARCTRRGLLVNAVRPNAIRFLPPLVVTEEDIDEGLARLDLALADVFDSGDGEGGAS